MIQEKFTPSPQTLAKFWLENLELVQALQLQDPGSELAEGNLPVVEDAIASVEQQARYNRLTTLKNGS